MPASRKRVNRNFVYFSFQNIVFAIIYYFIFCIWINFFSLLDISFSFFLFYGRISSFFSSYTKDFCLSLEQIADNNIDTSSGNLFFSSFFLLFSRFSLSFVCICILYFPQNIHPVSRRYFNRIHDPVASTFYYFIPDRILQQLEYCLRKISFG